MSGIRRAKPSVEDEALLEAVRRGDTSAARAVLLRVRPQVERTIVRLLGENDAEHDDVVQASLIETIRSIANFRGDCSLDTWVSRVTAHVVFKEIRRRNSQKRLFDSVEIDLEEIPHMSDMRHETVVAALARRVRQHLGSIDPIKASVVVLYDVCGYDLKEVAEITDATVAATQSRLVRGRKELHSRLAADPELSPLLEKGGDDS